MDLVVTYFETPGKINTENTLNISKKYSEEQNIRNIIVASTTGYTGIKATELFDSKKYNLIVVSHSAGFKERGFQELSEENRREIEEQGATVLTTTHAFAGVERAFRFKLNMWQPIEILARTIRYVFCEGIKVVMEITMMAADSGLITLDEDVIAIGGTGRGADTACIIKPEYTSNFLDMRLKAILCKPFNF
jgi:hypothetical protein